MDEDLFKLSHIKLTEKYNLTDTDISDWCKVDKIQIGNNYTVVLFCKISGKQNENERTEWKRKMMTATVHTNFQQQHQHCSTFNKTNGGQKSGQFLSCSLCSSVIESTNDEPKNLKKQKNLFVDNDTFVILIPVCAQNICHCSKKAQLNVSITVVDRQPLDLNVLNTEEDFQLHFQELLSPKKEFTYQKIFNEELEVLPPPELLFRFVFTSGKYLLFVKVINYGNDPVQIHDCTILCGICHWNMHVSEKHDSNCSYTCQYYEDSLNITNKGSCVFPSTLLPGEETVIVFTFINIDSNNQLKTKYHLHSVKPAAITSCPLRQDLEFHTHLKWSSSSESVSKVTSSYRLPKLKLRSVPFVLSAHCLNDNISIGQSFTVMYSVVNKLQNFLSWRLYWNPVCPEINNEFEENRRSEYESLKNCIVCNDPYIDFGAFLEGKSNTTAVNFQVLGHGLYELGKHMKLNLCYAVNPNCDDERKSLALSETSECSADKYAAASEDLWRGRIGSTSSLERDGCASRRESFATKSYSFGDLGPELSLDSDDGDKNRFKDKVQNVSLHTPNEEVYKIPTSNFKKNSYQLYLCDNACKI